MADETQQQPTQRRRGGVTRTSWRKGQSGNPAGRAARNLKLLRAANEADARESIAAAPTIAEVTDPRCTVCQSPLRAKIERWRVGGMGFAAVARRLRERYGDEYAVSQWAVQRHFQNHVQIAELEQAYYATQRAEIEATSADAMSVLERLEAENAMLYRRAQDIGEDIETLRETGKPVPLPLSQLWLGALEEGRHRARMITELRGAQPGDEVDSLLASLWEALPPAAQPDPPPVTAPSRAAASAAEALT